MKILQKTLTASMLFLISPSVFAHAGHGNPDWVQSFLHYFIELPHVVFIFPLILSIVVLLNWFKKSVN